MTCPAALGGDYCAIEHWCKRIPHAHREGAGWRADCLICAAERAIEWDAPGKSVRWRLWCACPKDAVRKALAAILPAGCLPGRSTRRDPIDHDVLTALALDISLPPMTLRLRLLEMTGMSTTSALDKLGVRPDHRRRVIDGRTGGPPKWAKNRRS